MGGGGGEANGGLRDIARLLVQKASATQMLASEFESQSEFTFFGLLFRGSSPDNIVQFLQQTNN